MKTVFISGSSKIKRLNKEMTDCLDELMKQDVQVIVGDCYGVDFLAQKYLKAHNFDRVTVYTSTEDAVLFEDQLRNECGLTFCTKHDCINEFNTDFRTFDIKEIHG